MPCCGKVTEVVDKELDDGKLCVDDIKKALSHIDKNVTETITLYQRVILSHEKVAQSYTELSQKATPASQDFVKTLAHGITAFREGKGMNSLQGDIGKKVRERYDILLKEHEKVRKMCKAAADEQLSSEKYKDDIARMEKKYAKKNKLLSESKTYEKLCKKRDESKNNYNAKKMAFVTGLDHLKGNVGTFAIDTFGSYVNSTSSFTKFLGEEMERHIQSAANQDNSSKKSSRPGSKASQGSNPLVGNGF